MAKIRFGKKNQIEYTIPELQNYVNYSKHETLFVFGSPEDNLDRRYCLGVGRVSWIEKGDKMDLVYINFGRKYARKIVVINNHARKQIYTLKKGQLAWFYGYFKGYKEDKVQKTLFFAQGLQGWYVPKALDIKHYDSETLQELEKENETDLLNFLDEIL